MPKQLKPEDQRAVDLVMDRESVGTGAMYASVTNGMGERIERVEKIMHLLDQMPVDEPPADLTRRTLEHIQQAKADLPHRTRPIAPPPFRPHVS